MRTIVSPFLAKDGVDIPMKVYGRSRIVPRGPENRGCGTKLAKILGYDLSQLGDMFQEAQVSVLVLALKLAADRPTDA